MFKRAEKDHTYVEFTSINDLVGFINRAEICSCFKARPQSITGDYSFTKTNSFEESMDILLHGWEHGTREIKRELDAKHVNVSAKTKNVYDVHGYQCSVPMYLNNVPTNMIRKQNVMRKDKIINIYKSINYACGVNAKIITKESVKVLQLVNRLENQGYRVNLHIVLCVDDRKACKKFVMVIPIKKSNQRLNIKQVAYPLCHASMLRRTMFAVIERTTEHNNEQMARLYGFICDNKTLSKHLEKYVKVKSYVIPAQNVENELLDIEKFAIN